jgi:hypothetical protein
VAVAAVALVVLVVAVVAVLAAEVAELAIYICQKDFQAAAELAVVLDHQVLAVAQLQALMAVEAVELEVVAAVLQLQITLALLVEVEGVGYLLDLVAVVALQVVVQEDLQMLAELLFLVDQVLVAVAGVHLVDQRHKLELEVLEVRLLL